MRHVLGMLIAAASLLSSAVPAFADAPIVVNDKRDLPDADVNDGICDADLVAAGQQITLRAAVMHANFVMGADVIQIPKGKFKLKLKSVGADVDASTGDLDVFDDLVIQGAGPKKTILLAKKLGDRAFHADNCILSITELSIVKSRNVSAPALDGGAIFGENGANVHVTNSVIRSSKCSGNGGAIALSGSSFICENLLLEKNKADGSGGGIGAETSTLQIEESCFAKNKSGADGGGIQAVAGQLTIINSTLSGNRAQTGGAIHVLDGVTAIVNGCTIAENSATNVSGMFASTAADPNTVTFSNTIMANDPLTNYGGTVLASDGGNIDTGTSCGFVNITDQSTTDPKLKPLANNGGPTPTHAITKNSKAVDHGNDAIALPIDQRGKPRADIPGKGVSIADVGAFELQP